MSTDKGSFDLLDDLALAHALADMADAITLDRYQAQDLVVTNKPDNTPVTDADRAVETAIREALATHRHGDGLVGEEFGSDKGSSGRYWVIDPIDGTKNFMRGVPTWATLIALVQVDSAGNEEVIVGIASAPALARRWAAAKGHGATVRFNPGNTDELTEDFDSTSTEKKISVSKVSSLNDASISYSDFVGWGERLEPFQKMLANAWRTRGIGDFWSHMLVAEGAVDVAVEPSLAVWDMAALDIIVREAGGTFTNTAGQNGPFGGSGVSTNGLLHNAVINGLNP
ncbi:MAG: histidinol phosphatase [Acidobacteriota bacterium]|jgi:histidinol-phosphatase|nr:histidinol phosphatase [Acidobacteriota bacterium]